jgi:hypothetical protein
VTERNRVTPFGEIVAIPQRGLFLGNRGGIHRGHEIVRPWQVRRWITCALEHKGWVAPRWEPNRWTALFFFDEAVALAAGHRPCALCRRREYDAWLEAWDRAFGERPGADSMDRRLHEERVGPDRRQRRHALAWNEVPEGAFVVLGDAAALVRADRLVPWSPRGYGSPIERPERGEAAMLTPPATAAVLHHGYRPVLHPTAG